MERSIVIGQSVFTFAIIAFILFRVVRAQRGARAAMTALLQRLRTEPRLQAGEPPIRWVMTTDSGVAAIGCSMRRLFLMTNETTRVVDPENLRALTLEPITLRGRQPIPAHRLELKFLSGQVEAWTIIDRWDGHPAEHDIDRFFEAVRPLLRSA